MGFYAKAIVRDVTGHEYAPSGSQHEWIMNDIKTAAGAETRVRKSPMMKLKRLARVEIYSFSSVFDDSTYRLVRTVEGPTDGN